MVDADDGTFDLSALDVSGCHDDYDGCGCYGYYAPVQDRPHGDLGSLVHDLRSADWFCACYCWHSAAHVAGVADEAAASH